MSPSSHHLDGARRRYSLRHGRAFSRFIAHSAERHANEFAGGDRHSQRKVVGGRRKSKSLRHFSLAGGRLIQDVLLIFENCDLRSEVFSARVMSRIPQQRSMEPRAANRAQVARDVGGTASSSKVPARPCRRSFRTCDSNLLLQFVEFALRRGRNPLDGLALSLR